MTCRKPCRCADWKISAKIGKLTLAASGKYLIFVGSHHFSDVAIYEVKFFTTYLQQMQEQFEKHSRRTGQFYYVKDMRNLRQETDIRS